MGKDKKNQPEAIVADSQIVQVETIGQLIKIIRGRKVLLDADLAQLYEVETKAMNRAVRRNIDRFPEDFMFQLTREEFLRCQIGPSSGHGGRRYYPLAFTEQGVAMLSGILNSPRAIQVNIAIMRTFVRLREILSTNKALAKKLADIETKMTNHDKQFEIVFEAIGQLMSPNKKNQKNPSALDGIRTCPLRRQVCYSRLLLCPRNFPPPH
jgi:hypothetical protein